MNDKLAKAFLLVFGALVLILAFGVMIYVAECNKSKPGSVKNEMTNLVSCLAFYHAIYGGFPTGNNAQIMGALRGKNPRKMEIDPIGPRRMARTNEALDIWQTAYRFSFERNSAITVSSAGKNSLFGDDDDLVVRASLSDTNFPFIKIPPQLTNTPAQK